MKEKYIFFTLLTIAIVMLISARLGKKTEGEISAKEEALEKELAQAEQREMISSEALDIDRIEDLVAFSHYQGMVQRSPFFKVPEKIAQATKPEPAPPVIPIEEKTPLFIYKGKIVSGKRLLVIIEQTRSGEVFMVAKGENIDGYKVLEILDTEVVLSKKGRENITLPTIESP